MANKNDNTSCPCGSGRLFSQCCEPVITGDKDAGSAEALMRSRFSAFVINDEAYLLRSWHISRRPQSVNLDESVKWVKLKIIASSDHHVEFIATSKIQGKAHKLHETSRFVREGNEWFYIDGEIIT